MNNTNRRNFLISGATAGTALLSSAAFGMFSDKERSIKPSQVVKEKNRNAFWVPVNTACK